MSAFVVQPHTMSSAVRGICAVFGRYPNFVVPLFDGIDTSRAEAPTLIGRRLFTLNIEAVQQRYPDTIDRPQDMPGPCNSDGEATAHRIARDFLYRPTARRVSTDEMVASLKALHCLRYQCSEGNVPETPLYQEITRAIGRIADAIVSEMPAYEAAAWD